MPKAAVLGNVEVIDGDVDITEEANSIIEEVIKEAGLRTNWCGGIFDPKRTTDCEHGLFRKKRFTLAKQVGQVEELDEKRMVISFERAFQKEGIDIADKISRRLGRKVVVCLCDDLGFENCEHLSHYAD